MRRVRAPRADPADARRWLGFARYIARVAQLGSEDASPLELRRAADRCTDRTRQPAARRIRRALNAADEGRPFAPYHDSA